MNNNLLYKNIINGIVTPGLTQPYLPRKICRTHYANFLNFVSRHKQGNCKAVKEYFSTHGYPSWFMHDTPYINCEECRTKNNERKQRRYADPVKSQKYIQQINAIFSAIESGTFKRHGGNKLEIRWRQLAAIYAQRKKLPKDTSFKDRMRFYLEYREEHEDDTFYRSSKWRSVRSLIIEAYGNTCMKCKHPNLVGHELHCDHILPRSLFPEYELDLDNMQILCLSCNSSKSNRSVTDYRPSDWQSKLEALPE